LQISNKGVCVTRLATKLTALPSFGFKFFLSLLVLFLLIGCGNDNKIAMAAGETYSLALDSDSKVYVAGLNPYERLALSCNWYINNCKIFTEILSSNGKGITAMAAGGSHSIALGSDGKVYAIGYNGYGQLGLSDTTNRYSFTAVSTLSGKNIIAIAAGEFHSLALDSGGKVYVTGWNYSGELGLGDTTNRYSFTVVPSLNDKNITAITAGSYFSLILDSDGKVYGVGDNHAGQLGLGNTNSRSSFTEVSSLKDKNITAIIARGSHSFAIDNNGKVYAAGWNYSGKLGLGDTNDRNTFTKVSSLKDKNITAIATGNHHSFAIDSNGKVYVTGDNYHGQLGLGDVYDRYDFTEVSFFSNKNITTIAAGGSHSFVIDSSGKIYGAGLNEDGQLGLGDTKNRRSFTEVTR
jgi:alpha-tubulin suppressor-like RCC1 family protein